MATAGDDETICVSDLVDAMGERSFGPLLLVPSLILVSPLSGIPGLSSAMGLVIALIAGQMLFGRKVVWVPQRLRRQCIARQRVEDAIGFLRPAARVADRLIGPRLSRFTGRPFNLIIAAICTLAGLLTPLLEFTPFASSILAAAVAVFALAFVAQDGLLAIVALSFTASGLYFGFVVIL